MRFRSCFLLSIFSIFGFPIAVPNEGNPEALHRRDDALSIRNDGDVSNNFLDQPSTSTPTTSTSWTSGGEDPGNQPLSDEVQPLSNSPSAKSTILAQNAYSDGVNPASEWLLGPLIEGLGVGYKTFLDRTHAVHQGLEDDDASSNGKVHEGATSNPAGATPGAATDNHETQSDDSCPAKYFGPRTLAWCDSGDRDAIEERDGITYVHGYARPCTFFPN